MVMLSAGILIVLMLLDTVRDRNVCDLDLLGAVPASYWFVGTRDHIYNTSFSS